MGYADYWIKRADARMAEAHSSSDEVIQQISKAYDEVVSQLNKDIDRLFYRFASGQGLTEEQAKELLNQQLSVNEVKEIRKRISLIEDEEIRKELEAKLQSTVTRARITRLEALKEDIYIQTSRMADVELKLSSARYFSIIEEEYLHNIFDFQQYLGFTYSFSEIPVNTIQEILKDNWSGKHYSKRIWENSLTNGKRIEETVEQLLLKGTMLGTNSRKMAAELNKLTNTGMYACERLIRTETTYFVAMADKEAAKRRGTKKVQFVATLDNRTSDQCRENDGKIIPIEEAIPGKTIPPLHPFCRSVIIDVIGGLVHKVRTARNPLTGKNYKIPADMTYQQWNDKYVKSGKLLVPDIQNPMMQQSVKDFETTLNDNDDGSNVFQMMRFCKDNATYTEDRSISGAYAYDMETDEFKYNPTDENFNDYDMNFVYSHELAHRLDATWCRSWESKKFLSAIEDTKKKLYNNRTQVEKWLQSSAGDDAGFSDIIDALSNGEMSGISAHGTEYWEKSAIHAPMEIFANLIYIKTMKPKSVSGTEGFLKELFEALEELI